MTLARYAPFSIVAAFGVAFASACGDEKTVADAVSATTTLASLPQGPLDLQGDPGVPGEVASPRGGGRAVPAVSEAPAAHAAVALYRWRRELH